jgi:hypothetical protein
MNDTDRLIAAVYAAAEIGKHDGSNVYLFFTYYEVCLRELQAREAAAGTSATGTARTPLGRG